MDDDMVLAGYEQDAWVAVLHEIAFRPVPAEQTTTLGYFMRDYVDHLAHNLEQLGMNALGAEPWTST